MLSTSFRAGVNPKLISARLGHSSVAFTLDTYTDNIPELDQTTAEQVSRLFFPLPNPTPDDTNQGETRPPKTPACTDENLTG